MFLPPSFDFDVSSSPTSTSLIANVFTGSPAWMATALIGFKSMMMQHQYQNNHLYRRATSQPQHTDTRDIVDLIICLLSVLGALSIIIPYARSKRSRKLRHSLILGLATSDLVSSLIITSTSSYSLAGGNLSNAKEFCNFAGYSLAVSIWTQHQWNLSIAIITYMILVHPLSNFVARVERHLVLLWPLFWSIALLANGIPWIFYGFGDVGGYCTFAPTNSQSRFPAIFQFVPRALVVLVVMVLYTHLFFFLRRVDMFNKAGTSQSRQKSSAANHNIGGISATSQQLQQQQQNQEMLDDQQPPVHSDFNSQGENNFTFHNFSLRRNSSTNKSNKNSSSRRSSSNNNNNSFKLGVWSRWKRSMSSDASSANNKNSNNNNGNGSSRTGSSSTQGKSSLGGGPIVGGGIHHRPQGEVETAAIEMVDYSEVSPKSQPMDNLIPGSTPATPSTPVSPATPPSVVIATVPVIRAPPSPQVMKQHSLQRPSTAKLTGSQRTATLGPRPSTGIYSEQRISSQHLLPDEQDEDADENGEISRLSSLEAIDSPFQTMAPRRDVRDFGMTSPPQEHLRHYSLSPAGLHILKRTQGDDETNNDDGGEGGGGADGDGDDNDNDDNDLEGKTTNEITEDGVPSYETTLGQDWTWGMPVGGVGPNQHRSSKAGMNTATNTKSKGRFTSFFSGRSSKKDHQGVGNDSNNTEENGVESLGSTLNRQASILLLLYPLVYCCLFSVSIIRIIVDLSNPIDDKEELIARNYNTLHSVSRWTVFAQGASDAIIFQIVERSFRMRMKRRRRIAAGEIMEESWYELAYQKMKSSLSKKKSG